VGRATLSQMFDANDHGYGLGVIRFSSPSAPGATVYGNGGKDIGYTTITYYDRPRRP